MTKVACTPSIHVLSVENANSYRLSQNRSSIVFDIFAVKILHGVSFGIKGSLTSRRVINSCSCVVIFPDVTGCGDEEPAYKPTSLHDFLVPQHTLVLVRG